MVNKITPPECFCYLFIKVDVARTQPAIQWVTELFWMLEKWWGILILKPPIPLLPNFAMQISKLHLDSCCFTESELVVVVHVTNKGAFYPRVANKGAFYTRAQV